MLKGRQYGLGIWGLALGYFIFYIPYSALTKSLSDGQLPGMEGSVSGFELLPATVIAVAITMPLITTMMGWWKYLGHRKILGLTIPCPNRWTFLSGISFAVIIATTTLAYTFSGISIVFALLLMRGGVLILAPIVDATLDMVAAHQPKKAQGFFFCEKPVCPGIEQWRTRIAVNLENYWIGGEDQLVIDETFGPGEPGECCPQNDPTVRIRLRKLEKGAYSAADFCPAVQSGHFKSRIGVCRNGERTQGCPRLSCPNR